MTVPQNSLFGRFYHNIPLRDKQRVRIKKNSPLNFKLKNWEPKQISDFGLKFDLSQDFAILKLDTSDFEGLPTLNQGRKEEEASFFPL